MYIIVLRIEHHTDGIVTLKRLMGRAVASYLHNPTTPIPTECAAMLGTVFALLKRLSNL